MSKKKSKKTILVGPVRTNLEAFGVAILAAVLLKWFCIEAYQIPTSSMQPTLMGSSEADVYDRILVDKLIQTWREPQRWDITVFKYPLQKNQNYVKRIGGMPGDRLFIGGGNLYQVSGDGAARTFTPIRKPDDLQEEMWKNVFPARMETRSETKMLGEIWAASPGKAASEVGEDVKLSLANGVARLFFRDEADGGMVDRVWDGYPAAVASKIREKTIGYMRTQEIVPDCRLGATVTTEQALDEFALEIDVSRPGNPKLTFAFVVRGDKATLEVRDDKQTLGKSDEFACALAAGTPTGLMFAHVDDMLIAWRDGDELQRFDAAAWAIRDGCVLPQKDGRLEFPINQRVVPQFSARGKGNVTLQELRLDRDQHYTRDQAPEVIEVPEGHYYMLGDNTLQSIDSRGWTAITIGVDADDNVVPPDSPEAVRTLRGNKRPMSLANPPDRDETPIAYPEQKAIVIIDEYGELHRLKAEIGPNWGNPSDGSPVVFIGKDGKPWTAPTTTNTKGISFVPRSDIQGRALLVFYPFRPISWLTGNAWPGRFGFVR
ncbi:MAG: signal peptidase I [Planctomycetes bacterium]|nr:signal peptidase I [Planctomycetota bacterium]